MIIIITNIFTVPDKFITVKMIILIIEICIFAAEGIDSFIKLFSADPENKFLITVFT